MTDLHDPADYGEAYLICHTCKLQPDVTTESEEVSSEHSAPQLRVHLWCPTCKVDEDFNVAVAAADAYRRQIQARRQGELVDPILEDAVRVPKFEFAYDFGGRSPIAT